ncbi:CapA family protein [Streptomyces rimosus]|uniref:CapA family protein n=1 Tax=Streptomyces rimosus TaxID=1927 RepID=UPI0007C6B7BB|nr:CapA family protein [Streptomyces rimosus]
MAVTIASAGDIMLGRGVAEEVQRPRSHLLFSGRLREAAAQADLFVVNLECCISERGGPAPVPGKSFFYRAPPAAVDVLVDLGVDVVSLADNHALDFGAGALADARRLLAGAGIETVGAGANAEEARTALVMKAGELSVGIVAVTDRPADFAAGPGRPGMAHGDLRRGLPDWLADRVHTVRRHTDITLVSVRWGPNIVSAPVSHVRRAAADLAGAGAPLVAGHSAHVFHGFIRHVSYALGDFTGDYATHPALLNDLELLWLVTLDEDGPWRTEAVPITLDHCHTRLADQAGYDWTADRLTTVCAALGTRVAPRGDRLVANWPRRPAHVTSASRSASARAHRSPRKNSASVVPAPSGPAWHDHPGARRRFRGDVAPSGALREETI